MNDWTGFARSMRFRVADRDDPGLGACERRRLYAFDDLCPYGDRACPLSGGLLTGTTLMCQCHGSRFDITTGATISGPATEALNVYEVHEVDGDVHVRA